MTTLSQLLSRHSPLLLLLLITLTTHVWYGVTHFGFAQDQSRDWLLMEEFGNSGQWLVGYGPPTSTGNFFLPPFYYQLNNIVSHVTSNNIYAMQWVILLIESLTPLLLFVILRYFVSEKFGLATSVLYAFSPIVIVFATSIWNPNLVPFFSTLALLAWLKYTVGNKNNWLLVGCVATTLVSQLHFQGLFLVLFPGILFLWSVLYRRHSMPYWIIGIFLSVATLIPYLWIEGQNQWTNTQKIIHFVLNENSVVYDRVTKPQFVLSFIPSFVERLLIGGNTLTVWLGRLIFWLGIPVLFYFSIKRERKYLWLLLYFTSILLMLRVYKGDKLDYYMSVLFIFPYVMLALVAEFFTYDTGLSRYTTIKNNKTIRLIGWVVILGIFIFIGFRQGKHISHVANFNEHDELMSAVRYINSVYGKEKIKLNFQNKDFVYNFRYGFYISNLIDDNRGELFIDVCSSGRPCAWDGKLVCTHDKAYTETSLLKESNQYTLLDSKTFGRYQLVVGELIQN